MRRDVKVVMNTAGLYNYLCASYPSHNSPWNALDQLIIETGITVGTPAVVFTSPGRFTICTPEVAAEIERREQIFGIIETAMNRPGELLGKKIKITHKNDPTETVCSIYFVGGVEQLLVIQALKIGTQEPMSILPLCYLLDSHHAMTIELID